MNFKHIMVYVFGALFTLMLLMNTAKAAIENYSFDTPQQEQDYNILIYELRCLVCQNQNLADSNAELAQDLRKQVHKMIVEEKQDRDAIVEYMVNRYGDFVLYNPPVKNQTYLLWAGPFLFLLFGLWILLKIVKNASNKPTDNSEEDDKPSSKPE